MVQIRPDELIRILRGELEAIGAGGGAALLGYDENGAFAGGQAVTGANSIGMGDTAAVGANADYSVVGGGYNNNIAAGDYSTIGGGRDNSVGAGGGSPDSTICGGRYNSIGNVTGAFIGGGYKNRSQGGYSTIVGGNYNRITSGSGDYSAIVGGQDNLISSGLGWNFIGGGEGNIIRDNMYEGSILGGYGNDLSATNYSAICGGDSNLITAGRHNVISGGWWNEITTGGDNAAIPGGVDALADKFGQIVSGGGYFTATGDAQGTIQIVASLSQASHVLNTWYELHPYDVAGNHVTIAGNTAWTIYCLVVGSTQNAAQQWGYELIGLIERDNANNTTLAGQTLRVIFESDANYNTQFTADDANEALVVEVRRTGGVDYNVRWVATLRMAEVTYP